MRTSFAAGQPQMSWRDGYRVIRKAGRYMVFPRAAFSEMMGWHGGSDGLVEIWNGMPFFSPLWARTPHITFLHHVHAEMWDMTLPPRLARVGRTARGADRAAALPAHADRHAVGLLEAGARRRPRLPATTSSTSCRPASTRGSRPAARSRPTPLVVAAGRLVPVKRFDLLIEALVALEARATRTSRPSSSARATERDQLETQIHEAGAERWIHLPGHLTDDELVDLYRRAWLLASASAREGWGMTLTEAAACGTPAVVTRIAGHGDAVDEGAPACSPTGATGCATRSTRCSPTPALRRPARRRRARARDPLHLGRDRPRHPRGARRRGDAPAPPPVTPDPGRASG